MSDSIQSGIENTSSSWHCGSTGVGKLEVVDVVLGSSEADQAWNDRDHLRSRDPLPCNESQSAPTQIHPGHHFSQGLVVVFARLSS